MFEQKNKNAAAKFRCVFVLYFTVVFFFFTCNCVERALGTTLFRLKKKKTWKKKLEKNKKTVLSQQMQYSISFKIYTIHIVPIVGMYNPTLELFRKFI